MHLFYAIFIIVFLGISFGTLWGVGWFPTGKRDYERIFMLADLKPNDIFYDLGSGSGELLFYLSRYHNVKCVGIEISPFLYFYSKCKSLFYRDVEIHYGNFFTKHFKKADVVYIFLIPSLYEKLREKINAELKDGSRVIFSCWPLEGSAPIKADKENDSFSYFLYKKPL